MKNIIVAGISASALLLSITSCHKKETPGNVTNTTTSTSPASNTAAKGTGYTRKAKQNETNHKWDCTESGTTCKASLVVPNDPEVTEIALLQQIIAQTGNGNAYFSTQNWSVLFDDDDPQTLLARIGQNQVFLYQMESDANHGTTYGYSYVLSTATSIQNVNESNTEGVWQY